MFSIYGESQLESINTNSTPEEVLTWKQSTKTKSAYRKLFTSISDDPDYTYMSRILAKVWPGGDPTNLQLAFGITVCQTTLSSHYKKLTINEDAVERKLIKNLVSNSIYFNILN